MFPSLMFATFKWIIETTDPWAFVDVFCSLNTIWDTMYNTMYFEYWTNQMIVFYSNTATLDTFYSRILDITWTTIVLWPERLFGNAITEYSSISMRAVWNNKFAMKCVDDWVARILVTNWTTVSINEPHSSSSVWCWIDWGKALIYYDVYPETRAYVIDLNWSTVVTWEVAVVSSGINLSKSSFTLDKITTDKAIWFFNYFWNTPKRMWTIINVSWMTVTAWPTNFRFRYNQNSWFWYTSVAALTPTKIIIWLRLYHSNNRAGHVFICTVWEDSLTSTPRYSTYWNDTTPIVWRRDSSNFLMRTLQYWTYTLRSYSTGYVAWPTRNWATLTNWTSLWLLNTWDSRVVFYHNNSNSDATWTWTHSLVKFYWQACT